VKERPRTIGEVSRASGVSPRTLRYYEERGLLRPARTEAGYCLYTAADERRLAHIMAMRSCGLPLTAIEHIMGDDEPNIHGALLKHLRTLRAQEKSLDAALHRTQAALHAIEGITNMSTEDAFEKLKQQGLESFEETYGREARERYGSAVIDATMPGRWAAPPAPAMMTRIPRPRAVLAYSHNKSGVRWALTTRFSSPTPNSPSVRTASAITS